MAYPVWQIGMDVQNGVLRALAVQRRRHGWQLRQWWQLPLPSDTLRGGSLHNPAALCAVLQRWKRELPHYVSLRLAFPADRVLQQRLSEPDGRLREPERGWYIEKMAAKKLPVSSDALIFDYRIDPSVADSVLVTAARKAELALWLDCFRHAGLQLDAVDITPCALRCMARQAGLASDNMLVHRFEDRWLWVSSLNATLAFGTVHVDDAADFSALLSYVSAHYEPMASEPIYLSTSAPDFLPQASSSFTLWSPLPAFSQQQPPLPAFPSAFVIAGGLAVRPEDV
ncbi:type IV pilus biogenesis protein PilM [Musicola keenii]|uniref:type IV pilus biogenesis protein PilM n=1 Tax=Musicola keenii TaxID=2884250 RepID=UPI00177E81B0|nr:pilus assembly protein PilM [Musicola keenii]